MVSGTNAAAVDMLVAMVGELSDVHTLGASASLAVALAAFDLFQQLQGGGDISDIEVISRVACDWGSSCDHSILAVSPYTRNLRLFSSPTDI